MHHRNSRQHKLPDSIAVAENRIAGGVGEVTGAIPSPRSDHVWFYDVQDYGFSLDDKRDPLYQDEQGNPLQFSGDLPKVLAGYQSRDKTIANTEANDKTQASFWVSKADIAANKYDLSVNRYKETVHYEEQYESPQVILRQWMGLVDEIAQDLKSLESML